MIATIFILLFILVLSFAIEDEHPIMLFVLLASITLFLMWAVGVYDPDTSPKSLKPPPTEKTLKKEFS